MIEEVENRKNQHKHLHYIELIVNFLILSDKDIEKRYPTYRISETRTLVQENIDIILDNSGYEIVEFENDERYELCKKNPVAHTVATRVESNNIAIKIMRYNSVHLVGNLEEKKTILKHLSDDFEHKRNDLKSINSQLEKKLFHVINNYNIRHDNPEVDASEQEVWYDAAYETMLFAWHTLYYAPYSRKIKDSMQKCDNKAVKEREEAL